MFTEFSSEPMDVVFSMSASPAEGLVLSELRAEWEGEEHFLTISK